MKNLRVILFFLFSPFLQASAFAQPGADFQYIRMSRELQLCVESYPDSAHCVIDLALLIPTEENLLNALRFDSVSLGQIAFDLSQRYTSLRDNAAAVRYAELSFQHGKRDVEYADYRINLALAQGEEEYTKWLDWGLQMHPANPNFLNQKAIQYLRKNEYTTADSIFRKAVEYSGEYSRSLIGPWVEMCTTVNTVDARVWAQSLLASTTVKNERFLTLIQLGQWHDKLWNDPWAAIQYYSDAVEMADEDVYPDSILINGLSNQAGLYRGLCYWRIGDRLSATSDWICSVMYEYDENPEMIQLFDHLLRVDPEDIDLLMLRWMYRQNLHHFTPETNVSWALDHIHAYENRAQTQPYGHVIQAYCAKAYFTVGNCKKAKTMMARIASKPPNFFSLSVNRKLENCD